VFFYFYEEIPHSTSWENVRQETGQIDEQAGIGDMVRSLAGVKVSTVTPKDT